MAGGLIADPTPAGASLERAARRGRAGRVLTEARRSPSLTAGLVLLGLLVLFAVIAPVFGDPMEQDIAGGLTIDGLPRGPGEYGLLGSDGLGRDMLARLAYGARTSLLVAALANVASLALGALVGLIAGYFRGVPEAVLMRITDIALAMPYVLTALVLATVLSSGIVRVLVIVTALFWAYPARMVYGEALRLRGRGFVEAAEASGAGGLTTIRRHVLPHVRPLLLTYAPLNAAAAVLFESTLSYLGAGVNPPTASWGNMISEGQGTIDFAPHLLIEPMALLFVTALSLLLISQGLKERNPEGRRVSWLAT